MCSRLYLDRADHRHQGEENHWKELQRLTEVKATKKNKEKKKTPQKNRF